MASSDSRFRGMSVVGLLLDAAIQLLRSCPTCNCYKPVRQQHSDEHKIIGLLEYIQ